MDTTLHRLARHRLAYRYALYLSPTGPWLEFGRRWLGRCADTGATLASPAPDDWVAEPRRYGLHATLKAPFRLAPSVRPGDLDRVARRIALCHRPFELPLVLTALRGFLAWRVAPGADAAQAAIDALACDALCRAEPLRASLNQEERAHHLAQPLTTAQQTMLETWGYPYALDTYVFHITLTNSLPVATRKQVAQHLAALAPACQTGQIEHAQAMTVQALGVYVQPQPGADFLVARHYDFDGTTTDGAGAEWLRA